MIVSLEGINPPALAFGTPTHTDSHIKPEKRIGFCDGQPKMFSTVSVTM